MFLIKYKKSSAKENMLLDSNMLEACALHSTSYLRFYGWTKNCYTCGISQNVDDIKVLFDKAVEITKRPTGGGLVSHANDFTYALAFPKNHHISIIKAQDSYKLVHLAIAKVLSEFGIKCNLHIPSTQIQKSKKIAICFEEPAKYDVIASDYRKIAGAAQKRNKFGILFQGSIDKSFIEDEEVFTKKLSLEFLKLSSEDELVGLSTL